MGVPGRIGGNESNRQAHKSPEDRDNRSGKEHSRGEYKVYLSELKSTGTKLEKKKEKLIRIMALFIIGKLKLLLSIPA
jgi:hypothetical protein